MSASAYRLTSQRIELYCKVRLADYLPRTTSTAFAITSTIA